MGIVIRKSDERGLSSFEWLKSYHTFSFGEYFDPHFVAFRNLRVINEDFISPKKGFPPHPHRNMEILTVVYSGELTHQDSIGNKSSLKPYDIQVMTAGQGITHSEYNQSENPIHLLQIWIETDTRNLPSSYSEKHLEENVRKNKLCLIASKDQKDGSLKINQDAKVYLSDLESGNKLSYTFGKNRYGWLQLVKGTLTINGQQLRQGDGAALEKLPNIELVAEENASFIFFDLN